MSEISGFVLWEYIINIVSVNIEYFKSEIPGYITG